VNVTDVEDFERIEGQLHSMLSEMSELSKKTPNGALNKFKLKLINTLLATINRLIGDDRPFHDFLTFDEDDLPTNSDVVIMLSQYVDAIYKFRERNTEYSNGNGKWLWMLPGKKTGVATKPPREFKYHS
jgi:hypothetical protein